LRLYYWRTSHGVEVDLVIETPKKLWAIEIKASEQIEASQLQSLRSFQEDNPKARLIWVSPTPLTYQTGLLRL